MDAEETPVIPVVIRHTGLGVGHDGLFILIDPEPMTARRTCYDLLRLGYVIVVQRLTIGIQYRFIDHLRFHEMTFEP